MNKKGFAISIILYSMVFLLVAIFYMLLGIFKTRYTVMNGLRNSIIDDFNESSLLSDKILKLCYDPGVNYVKKYNIANGQAIDTPSGDDNGDVCYYTSNNASNSAGKNGNVIFGDYCWQIVRTTADGGVKLVYNGPKTSDDKCPQEINQRPTSYEVISEGGGLSSISLNGSKIYGESFEIINNNGLTKFRLKNTSTSTWSDSTYQNLIGKYICGTSSEPTGNDTSCEALYYVGSYVNNSTASGELYFIGTNGHYSQIGKSSFNSSSDSLSSVGYMFNETYPSFVKDYRNYIRILIRTKIATNTAYYYGDKAVWNSSTNKYDLKVDDGSGNYITPTSTTTWGTIRGNVKGKYTCMSDSETSCATVNYVVNNTSTLYMNSVPLSNNAKIEDEIINWKYQTYFTQSGNTFILPTPSSLTIPRPAWYDNYDNEDYKNIYLCSNYVDTACEELIFIYRTGSSEAEFNKSSDNYIFGNSVTYSNGNYTINTNSDPSKYQKIWDWAKNYTKISKSHYTCFKSDTNECGSSVYYVYFASTEMAYYIELKNGEIIEDSLDKMLNISNLSTSHVNKYNSSVKGIVDSWYEQNLSGLSNYIDDNAVFCNDRNAREIGSWSSTGDVARFNFDYASFPSELSASLTCDKMTDRFSKNNTNLAKLKYPVGLLTGAEIGLMNTNYVNTEQVYWTMSPAFFDNSASVSFVRPEDVAVSNMAHTAYGIRPVIVLNHDVQVTGKGTYDKPYVVEANGKSLLTVTALNQVLLDGEGFKDDISQISVSGLNSGDFVYSITLTRDANAIIPSEIVIKDGEGSDVTSKYEITYVNGTITDNPGA